MKKSSLVLCIGAYLISSSIAFASSLWLDASCKVSCASVSELVPSQGGMITSKKPFTVYLELEALSRKAIDTRINSTAMIELCQKNAKSENTADKIIFEKVDCLYFKNR